MRGDFLIQDHFSLSFDEEAVGESYEKSAWIMERYQSLDTMTNIDDVYRLYNDITEWIMYIQIVFLKMRDEYDRVNLIRRHFDQLTPRFKLSMSIATRLRINVLLLNGPKSAIIARFNANSMCLNSIEFTWEHFTNFVQNFCVSTQPTTTEWLDFCTKNNCLILSSLPYPYKLIKWTVNFEVPQSRTVKFTRGVCEWFHARIIDSGLTLSETIRYQLNCRHEPWSELFY